MTAASFPSLAPYVPRMVREWLDNDAAALHRRVPGTMVFVDISGFTKMSERWVVSARWEQRALPK